MHTRDTALSWQTGVSKKSVRRQKGKEEKKTARE